MANIGLKAGRPSASTPTATLADLKAETVRLNVDIDRDLHTKLKLRAVRSQRTITDLVTELLVESLQEE
jgi:hypothetical protein